MQESFAGAEASQGSSPGLEHDEIVKLPDGPAPVQEPVLTLQRDNHECTGDVTRVYLYRLCGSSVANLAKGPSRASLATTGKMICLNL